MKRVLLTIVFGLLITVALPAATRKWTSNDGRFSTEAELVELNDETVILKKRSGETVAVPLERLSELDRRFLLSWKKKLPSLKKNVVSYVNDVKPLLATYCAECHNPDKAKDGYDVTTFAALLRSGKKGAMVVPSKPDESRLMLTLHGTGKPMPPKKSPQPTAEEIAKFSAWIEAGAEDDSGVQGQPKPPRGKGKKPEVKR